jgi:Protein of unknown function (DUF4238)
MNEPRLQHYIPRFYLSGFADPRIQRRENADVIWVYEKGRQIRKSSPKNEARRRDFYSYAQNGSRNSDVEVWLGNLEAQVAPILPALAKDKRAITELEKEWLSLFMGTMHMRTPAARWLSEQRTNRLVSRLMTESAEDPIKFRRFVEENDPSIGFEGFDIEEVRLDILAGKGDELAARQDFELRSMVEVGTKVAGYLLKLKWQIAHSESDEAFLTSDDPFVSLVFDKARKNVHYRTGVATPGVIIVFPLSRLTCLRLSEKCESGAGRIPSSDIRATNKMVMTCADRFVYASEQSETLRSVFEKKGGRVSVKTADLRFEGQKY